MHPSLFWVCDNPTAVPLAPPCLVYFAQPRLGPCTHLQPGLLLLSMGRSLGWVVFKGGNLGYSCCWRGTSVPTMGFCIALPEIIAQFAHLESLWCHTSLQEPAGGDSTPCFSPQCTWDWSPHCLRHFKICRNQSSGTRWVLCCGHIVLMQMYRDPPWWSKVKRM